MPVIKDLVVDMGLFWEKVKTVEPWLQPEGPEPVGEYIAPNQDMLHLAGVMDCIMCGACVSDCTVLEVDGNSSVLPPWPRRTASWPTPGIPRPRAAWRP